MSTLLELKDVSLSFGGLAALDAVSFSVQPGEIIGLIGPNGAGKTTLVNVCTGVYRPSRGTIVFNGQAIQGLPDHRVAHLGMARTSQIVQPFPSMNVLENVAAAAMFGGGIRNRAQAKSFAEEQLEFVGLQGYASKPASDLSLAHRKRLELAKSLALKPRLVWLDEVNAGLNSGDLENTLSIIRKIAERGITIILIEHLMKVVLGVSSRILVLKSGALIADGIPTEVIRNPAVVEAYLGSSYSDQGERSND